MKGKTGKRQAGKAKRSEAGGELLRDAREVAVIEQRWQVLGDGRPPRKAPKEYRYVDQIAHLQLELLKLQEWVPALEPQSAYIALQQ